MDFRENLVLGGGTFTKIYQDDLNLVKIEQKFCALCGKA